MLRGGVWFMAQASALHRHFEELVLRAARKLRLPVVLLRLESRATQRRLSLALSGLGEVTVFADTALEGPGLACSPYHRWSFAPTPLGEIAALLVRTLAACDTVPPPPPELPPESVSVPVAALAPREERLPRRTVKVELPGPCDRHCLVCRDHLLWQREPSGYSDPDSLRQAERISTPQRLAAERERIRAELAALAGEAEAVQLVWWGDDSLASPLLEESVEAAYALGFRRMRVVSPGGRLAEPGFVQWLGERSVTCFSLAAHGASEETFDRLAGRPGAAALFWRSLDLLRGAEMEVGVNVALIRPLLQEIPALLSRLRGYGFPLHLYYWYPNEAYQALFPEIAAPFEQVIREVLLHPDLPAEGFVLEGMPPCVLPGAVRALRPLHYERRGWDRDIEATFAQLPACERCAWQSRCSGVSRLVLEHFGEPTMQPLSPAEAERVSGLRLRRV